MPKRKTVCVPTFWENASKIIGGNGNVLLNASDFRNYLSRYFGVGRALDANSRNTLDPHWVFLVRGSEARVDRLFCSVEEGYQPDFDCHCSLFSFYEELLISGFYPGLDELRSADTHMIYLSNLRKMYSALQVVFTDRGFVSYLYRFDEWEHLGRYLETEGILDAIDANLNMLKGWIREERGARGLPREIG